MKGNVTEVEGCFGNVDDMGQEGEVGVNDDSKVTDSVVWSDSGAIDMECEFLSGAGKVVWDKDYNL